MTLTPAARQIEQALEQGYEVVAFNLYRDALRQEIKLVEEEDVPNADSIEWHRSIQERVGWKTAAKEAEKTWNIGTLIQSETLPRDEDGVWTGGPPDVEIIENPDFYDPKIVDGIARALSEELDEEDEND